MELPDKKRIGKKGKIVLIPEIDTLFFSPVENERLGWGQSQASCSSMVPKDKAHGLSVVYHLRPSKQPHSRHLHQTLPNALWSGYSS